ncbi:MAG: hypothetical protein M1818_006942 [Claussenomyces sp. TS43310]|nr:MAG: hypothetical protein M1818_006942 [Claussenomyces sp. TS43310]
MATSVASLALLLISFSLAARVHAQAESPAFIDSTAYEDGAYGHYPSQEFISSNVRAPRVNILQTDSRCDDGSYVMLSVRGGTVEYSGPLILDHAGATIWTTDRYEAQVYGLNVQKYKGKDFLTLWAGDDSVRGHGVGEYILLDEAYNEVYKFGALGGLDGDLHEIKITDQDTFLISVYQVVPADLTPVDGPLDGWIWDCLIQELDIETGEVLFQWRASEHYSVTDSTRGLDSEGGQEAPWDWFHMNSIEKDPWGNYITSSRYLWSVTYINGTDGVILWMLGGKNNSFTDLSVDEGGATAFKYQHDARWHDNYTTISLFDNNAMDAGTIGLSGHSRGLRIKVDLEAMTAELLGEYVNPRGTLGFSQGSTQVLPNGNVFNGYGYTPAYSEFSSDGKLLCNVHFGPESEFNSGNVQSYRSLKANWTGLPTTEPSLVMYKDSAYVSWNGATEVKMWELQSAPSEDAPSESFVSANMYPKLGFETQLDLLDGIKPFIRVVARDKDDQIIGASKPVRVQDAIVSQEAKDVVCVDDC